MNKILRLTLITLLAMVGIVGYADDQVVYTLDGTQTQGNANTNYASGHDITMDDIAWNITGNLNINPWRIGGKSLTNQDRPAYSQTAISANVSKIEVAHGTRNLTVNSFKLDVYSTAALAAAGATGDVSSLTATSFEASSTTTFTRPSGADWTGRFYRFTWNVTNSNSSNKYTQLSSIKFYSTSGGTTTTVTAPEISGTTPFTDKTTVTITVPTGTTVYYTTDGNTPSDQGDEYDSPFEISATTTVKAVAYDNAGNHSSVVTKEFVKKANVTTTGQGTSASPYTVADANAILAAKAETTDTVFVSGTISQISEISTQYGNGTYYISDDGTTTNQLEVFRSYYLGNVKYTSEDQVKVGDKVVVKSVLVNYTNKDNTVTPELSKGYLYSLNGKTTADTPVIPTETAANIAAFNAISNNTPVVLTLTNAVVLYSWTSTNKNTSTYIRDASGAMLLYNSGIELKEGDVLNGTINVTRSAYNNNIQAAKNDNTNANNLTITSGSAPEPKTIASSEASNYANDLVLIKNVDIVAGGTRFYIVSDVSGDSLQVYNGFHLEGYTVAAATNVTVKGIVVDSKYGYEIQPTEDPATTTTGITGIKGDETSVNAPAYNLAGQRVGRDYKGVVIQNGKKRIRK